MGSLVFDQHDGTVHALEKIGEFIRHSGSGALIAYDVEIIVGKLEQFEEKLRNHRAKPTETELPMALYAAKELQKFIKGEKGDIAGKISAEVYWRYLRSEIENLRKYERELSDC
jgi:hypothetical protein